MQYYCQLKWLFYLGIILMIILLMIKNNPKYIEAIRLNDQLNKCEYCNILKIYI